MASHGPGRPACQPERVDHQSADHLGGWAATAAVALARRVQSINAEISALDTLSLNPGSNRHANHALWRLVITRLGQGEP
jgi:hypothetical protein